MSFDLSLGELQSLCVKAARGAGRAFGAAEDAGRAVRWLHERGMDGGADALAQLLQNTDGAGAGDLAPVFPDLTPAHDAMCPLMLGGYLSDMALAPQGELGPVWSPILMQPFLAGHLVVSRDATKHGAAMINLKPQDVAHPIPTQTRALIGASTMECLLAFAARTYAPSTEQSRALGAGAGLSDND